MANSRPESDAPAVSDNQQPLLLRGAHVVTMAPGRPDWETVDVLVEGQRITEVGPGLAVKDSRVLDMSGRIIIPGLINAHLHTWQTALRFLGADWTLPDYLANTHGGVGHHYLPDDLFRGTLAGALNQLDHGVTTIGDWSHNCLTPEHADAAIEALTATGVRAVFLYGTPYGLRDRPQDVRQIDRLLRGPIAGTDLLSMGLAIKGPQLSKPEVAVADFRAAAERNLIVSMHQSAGSPGPGWKAITGAGLWSPLVNIVHGTGLDTDHVKALLDAGVTFTSTPENELGQGHTTTLPDRLLALGAAPSLGTDTETATPADVLFVARMLLALQRSVGHDAALASTGLGATTIPVTATQALAWATIEGARALGLADHIGQITPGMYADLVVIDARALNLWPVHDPAAAALYAHPGNIEDVMVSGVWRKRDGRLTHRQLDAVKDDLYDSGQRLARRLNTPSMLGKVRRRVVQRVVNRQLRQQIQ
jgi:cytosine/adenosine deaminase-related metal-dependent hydrolase